MKQQQILTIVIATALGVSALPPALAAEDNLIIPGQSIGQTHLGSNGDVYLNKLPGAAVSDTSMQKTQIVWVSKSGCQRNTLYISTISNAALNVQPIRGVTIAHIEVTSSWFHTPDGISTGSTRTQILRQFPDARLEQLSDGKILSDKAKGIAFEFANNADTAPCISIGTATLGTLLTKREQFHSNRLGESVSIFNHQTQARLQDLSQIFTGKLGDPQAAQSQAVSVLGQTVSQQAYLLAFSDCFYFIGIGILLSGIVILFFKKIRKPGDSST